MTKAELFKRAVVKLKQLSKKELENFVENINCCPHKHTYVCGMDTVCETCGDWV